MGAALSAQARGPRPCPVPALACPARPAPCRPPPQHSRSAAGPPPPHGTRPGRGPAFPAPRFPRPPTPHEEDPLSSDVPAPRPPAQAQAPAGLRRFNDADHGAAEEALLACCGSTRWALRLAAHRPYPDVESLLAAASEASYDLRPADLAEALADESWMPHSLLGMRAPGSQAARTALQAAHAAYEARFGHVFVVCLEACPPEEMLDAVLASVRGRLGNDPDEERLVAAEELRRIALGRLEHLVASPTGAGAPA
ncbi:2-oxo-4-hydroxy-4-carboxy-5-ureidoimidazoline decarboxylase [Streptomyces sp. NPDC001380]|uniref:2-oxo-4-hydroxy-4-carboxy-5-ureidoimidazoline decarboxylase n=1 Tax=Streptomyces sp. NPDC001380 TaxID=3364566 RepID=UPI0036CAC6BC